LAASRWTARVHLVEFRFFEKERIEQAKADWKQACFDSVPGDPEFTPLPDPAPKIVNSSWWAGEGCLGQEQARQCFVGMSAFSRPDDF
jgi:hypothetical protein